MRLRIFQGVDVVLSMRVEGVVKLFQRLFVVIDAPVQVGEVSLWLRSRVACVFKPSQNENGRSKNVWKLFCCSAEVGVFRISGTN